MYRPVIQNHHSGLYRKYNIILLRNSWTITCPVELQLAIGVRTGEEEKVIVDLISKCVFALFTFWLILYSIFPKYMVENVFPKTKFYLHILL